MDRDCALKPALARSTHREHQGRRNRAAACGDDHVNLRVADVEQRRVDDDGNVRARRVRLAGAVVGESWGGEHARAGRRATWAKDLAESGREQAREVHPLRSVVGSNIPRSSGGSSPRLSRRTVPTHTQCSNVPARTTASLCTPLTRGTNTTVVDVRDSTPLTSSPAVFRPRPVARHEAGGSVQTQRAATKPQSRAGQHRASGPISSTVNVDGAMGCGCVRR